MQAKFLNDYFGYIDQTHLINHLDTLTNYEEGSLVTGYVLFTEQATKVTYLTLRNLEPVSPPLLKVGDIFRAEVKYHLILIFNIINIVIIQNKSRTFHEYSKVIRIVDVFYNFDFAKYVFFFK